VNINQAYDKKTFSQRFTCTYPTYWSFDDLPPNTNRQKALLRSQKYNIGIEERAHSATKHCVVCTFLGIWLTNETAKIKPMLVLLLLCILDF